MTNEKEQQKVERGENERKRKEDTEEEETTKMR